MKSEIGSQEDASIRFKQKLEDLKRILPPLGKNIGHSCAAVTFTNILEVLNYPDLKKVYFNNLAIPFSGFASFESEKGWKGPCGAISGSIASIGIIMGGHEKIKNLDVPIIYGKALRLAGKFEEKFGSLSCQDLCGYNLQYNLKEYVKNRVWENKCCNYVLFAIEQVFKLVRKDLKEKWLGNTD
jgi:hypothetical protein